MKFSSKVFEARPRWRASAPEAALVALMGLIVAVTFVLIVVTLNRGFDWTDEAFVYTMIASNRTAPGDFWGFQHLLHPIYELFGRSVLAFRVLRLIGYVGLSLLLMFIAKKVLASRTVVLRRSSWVVVALVAQVGTFAAWSHPPRYLGYNELSSWLAQVGGAVLLFLLLAGSIEPATRRARIQRGSLWTLVGVLITMMLFAKVTAAIIFFCLALVVMFAPVYSRGGALRRLSALIGGVVLALGLMVMAGIPVSEYVHHVSDMLLDPSAQAASGYSLSDLIVTYLQSAGQTARAVALPVILATYVLLVSGGAFRKPRAQHDSLAPSSSALENTAVALTALLALILLFPGTASSWDRMGNANTFMFCVAVLAFAVVLPAAAPVPVNGERSNRRTLVVCVGLSLFALVPFVNAVGTNNAIFGQTVFSATLWAVGAGVALCLLWERSTARLRTARILPVMISCVIVAAAAYSVAADAFMHPYRTAPYLSQTSPVSDGDLRGVLLTEGEPEMYEWTREAGFRHDAASVPAIALRYPDRLFGFNASAWASPWPGPAWQASIEAACAKGPPKDLFVLEPLSEPELSTRVEKLNAGLRGCGIHFPTDFRVVEKYEDKTHNKWSTTIWRLN